MVHGSWFMVHGSWVFVSDVSILLIQSELLIFRVDLVGANVAARNVARHERPGFHCGRKCRTRVLHKLRNAAENSNVRAKMASHADHGTARRFVSAQRVFNGTRHQSVEATRETL